MWSRISRVRQIPPTLQVRNAVTKTAASRRSKARAAKRKKRRVSKAAKTSFSSILPENNQTPQDSTTIEGAVRGSWPVLPRLEPKNRKKAETVESNVLGDLDEFILQTKENPSLPVLSSAQWETLDDIFVDSNPVATTPATDGSLKTTTAVPQESSSKDKSTSAPRRHSRAALNEWYARKHNIKGSDLNAFLVTSAMNVDSAKPILWAATFVCPITKERFDAGTLTYPEKKPPVVYRVDGLNCYRRKAVALSAAAGRAMDVLMYRHSQEEGGNVPSIYYCKEPPWSSSTILEETAEDESVAATTNTLEGQPESSTLMDDSTESDDSGSDDEEEEESDDEEEEDEESEQESSSDDDDDEEFMIQHIPGGAVAFGGGASGARTTTIERLMGAWAQPTTTYNLQQGIAPRLHSPKHERNRIIRKAKSWIAKQVEQRDLDTGEGGNLQLHTPLKGSPMESPTNAPIQPNEVTQHKQKKRSQLQQKKISKTNPTQVYQQHVDKNEEVDQRDSAEEDAVEEASAVPKNALSGWTGYKKFTNYKFDTRRQTPYDPWRSKPIQKFSKQSSQNILTTGNMTLAALAASHQSLPFDPEPCGVEKTADEILDLLWSSNTQAGHPTVHTYNSYLKCLEGPSPLAVSLKATRIVAAMTSGEPWEGRILPKPDADTHNILLELMAQVGGAGGRPVAEYSTSTTPPNKRTFLALLSSMAHPPTLPGDDSGFDPGRAEKHIETMNKLADDRRDESLRPDTSVYNSGLRWSGGLASSKSRPYQRSLPWDNLFDIFPNGFLSLPEGHSSVREALVVENWLRKLVKEDAVNPDIETVEAVIQAWVRTGTEEGALAAESLAKQVLEKSLSPAHPRLQTFHPVIAAFVCGGRPEKVHEWLDILESYGASNQGLRPDGRVHAAPISAWLACQRIQTRAMKADDICSFEIEKNIRKGAEASAAHLKTLCERLIQQHTTNADPQDWPFLEARIFGQVIKAFTNLALHQCALPPSDARRMGLNTSISEMRGIVDQFEGLVVSLKQLKKSGNDEDRDGQQNTSTDTWMQDHQLRHLMRNSHQVYIAFLDGLLKLTDVEQELNGDDFVRGDVTHVIENLPALEKMVRRAEELSHILWKKRDRAKDKHLASGHAPDEGSVTYEDLFSYTDTCLPPQDSFIWKQEEFYSEVLKALWSSPPDATRLGDIVRITMLLLDSSILHGKNDTVTAAFKDTVRYLNSSIPLSDQERRRLLGRVRQGAITLRRRRVSPVDTKDIFALLDDVLEDRIPHAKKEAPGRGGRRLKLSRRQPVR